MISPFLVNSDGLTAGGSGTGQRSVQDWQSAMCGASSLRMAF
jgi:hypothetical protein